MATSAKAAWVSASAGGSVWRFVGDDRLRALRPTGGEFEGNAGAEADADKRGGGRALGIEDGDEVVDVDGDVDRGRIRETTRTAAAAVYGVDSRVAGGREKASETGQLGGRGERAVEE